MKQKTAEKEAKQNCMANLCVNLSIEQQTLVTYMYRSKNVNNEIIEKQLFEV